MTKPPVDLSFYRRRASVPATMTLVTDGPRVTALIGPLGLDNQRLGALQAEALKRFQARAERAQRGRR